MVLLLLLELLAPHETMQLLNLQWDCVQATKILEGINRAIVSLNTLYSDTSNHLHQTHFEA